MPGSIRRQSRARWRPRRHLLDKRAGAAVTVARDPRREQGHDRLELGGIIAPAADPLGIEATRELRAARRQHSAAADLRCEIAQLLGPFEPDRGADAAGF